MAKTPKRTADEAIQAVKGSGGVLSHIAHKLGISRPTLWAYIKKWPTLAQAIEDEREAVLNLGETELITERRDGAQAVHAETGKTFDEMKEVA